MTEKDREEGREWMGGELVGGGTRRNVWVREAGGWTSGVGKGKEMIDMQSSVLISEQMYVFALALFVLDCELLIVCFIMLSTR